MSVKDAAAKPAQAELRLSGVLYQGTSDGHAARRMRR